MGRVSREARLLFILLWTIADDFGRARAASRMLASLLYPYDDDAHALIEGWLVDLEQQSCIRRYEVDGDKYLEISKWLKHQKIDHPTASRLPEFRETSRDFAKPSESFAPRACARDLGPRTRTKDTPSETIANGSQHSEPNGSSPSALLIRPIDLKIELWNTGKRYLGTQGIEAKQAGALLGKWRKQYGDHAVIDAMAQAETCAASEPIAYIEASLRKRGSNGHDKEGPASKLVEGAARLLARRERERQADLGEGNGPTQPLLGRK